MTLRLTLTGPDPLYRLLSHLGPAQRSENLLQLEGSHLTAEFPSCLFSVTPALLVTTSQGSLSLSWPERHPQNGCIFVFQGNSTYKKGHCQSLYTFSNISISRVSRVPPALFSPPRFRRTGWLCDTTLISRQQSSCTDIFHVILMTALWREREYLLLLSWFYRQVNGDSEILTDFCPNCLYCQNLDLVPPPDPVRFQSLPVLFHPLWGTKPHEHTKAKGGSLTTRRSVVGSART